MSRVHAVMLAFNRHDVVRGAMENFEDTVIPNPDYVKWCFDPGYPIGQPENSEFIKTLCETFGWKYTRIENEGVLGNWNTVIHDHLGMVNGDFLITYDPDVRMDKRGWVPAMVEALRSEDSAVFCAASMWFHQHEWMYQPPYNRKVRALPSGVNIAKYDCLIAWSSGMWKADFLITRPRNFSCRGRWYGWNEHADYERMLKHGKTWLQVADYIDRHLGSADSSYAEWKQEAASGKTALRFEEWISGR